MSARSKIADALVAKLREINGTTPYSTNLFANAYKANKFWDEVTDFPYICVIPGYESREYLPGGFKWGYLTITLRVYVRGETPVEQLEDVLVDVEKCVDANRELTYDTGKETTEIDIVSIVTDEGLLAPFGVGEVTLQVRYQVL